MRRWWLRDIIFGGSHHEEYLEATTSLQRARTKLDEQDRRIRDLGAQVAAAEKVRRDLLTERTQIKIALGRVSTLEGLVEVSPTVLLVDGLARDHEELEARIESVLDLILTRRADGLPEDTYEYATLNRIAGLLQGQIPRVPDTIEEIDPDG